MLISPPCFKGEIVIPNITDPSVQNRVQGFIDKYEPICLVNVLGYELYKALLATPTDPRFVDLVEGAEFTNCYGQLSMWEGLVPTNCNESLIANFIYTKLIEDDVSLNTGYGMVKMSPAEAYAFNAGEKITRAWNSFSQSVARMNWFLGNNGSVYPEFVMCSNYIFAKPINVFDL